MFIILAIVLFLLGASIMAAIYNRRERNLAEVATAKAEKYAMKKANEAYFASQNASYYQREAQYWKGVVFGDKAQTIYGAALQSLQDGSGFAFQTKPSNNVVPFPNQTVKE